MTFKKVILIGLIVIMLESIAGYIYLTYQNDIQPDIPKMADQKSIEPITPPPPNRASLVLQSAQSAVKKGQNISIDVLLDTFSSNSSAADLIIRYDPSMLTLLQSTDSAKPFKDSPIYQKTVFNSLNAKQGFATMSAVSADGKTFQGRDFLTSLSFKALKVGPTEITIVFTPGETRDTNIVSETRDILESVQNLPITVLP